MLDMVDIPDPDISWDLDRLGTNAPSQKPSQPPSPSPTPNPTTSPTPNPTASPSLEPTSSPTTSEPSPAPATPAPATQAPATPAPITPASASFPTYSPTSLPTDDTPVIRTYYSCPPPSSITVETHDENGSDVIIEIPPPISTIRIDYDFQVQIMSQVVNEEEADIDYLLPGIQSRLGESLGEYMKSNTENGQDESNCGGYNVEDFRRRRNLLNLTSVVRRRATFEDAPTRIIDISSATDLSVDENQSCTPRNDGCYVVHGEWEATYVGYNEAGVTSSISRAVKEEMVDGGGGSSATGSSEDDYGYNLQFLGSQNDEAGQTRTAEPSVFSKIIGSIQEVVPAKTEKQPTPYGLTILAVLGATFLVLCYVVFVKGDGAEKVKDKMDTRKEKKAAKRKALGEEDDEKQTDSSDYCYDLESVAIDDDYSNTSGGFEHGGVELRSTRDYLFGSTKVGAAAATVFSKDSSRDSGKTKKMSNRAHELSYADAQKLNSLFEDEDEESTATGVIPGSPGCSSNSSSLQVGPRKVSAADAGCSVRSSKSNDDSSEGMNPLGKLLVKSSSDNDTRLVDRTPSCVTPRSSPNMMDSSPASANSPTIYQLPSISEAELPPPMNDTPRHRHNRFSLPFSSSLEGGPSEASEESQEWEV